jgi:Ca-activated chloride channel family protein
MLHLTVLSFEHIHYLTAIGILLPLVVLFVFVLRKKQQIKKALGDPELIDRLTANYSQQKYKLKFYAVLVALILLIVAVANPRLKTKAEETNRAGIDLLIVLDVSKSMWSLDIKPSRLDKSKQLINYLMDKVGNNRIGLVLFAGQAYLQMPITNDAAAAKMYVANASPDAVPTQGTAIADALLLADKALNTQQKKYKAVVLITDGENHEADALAPAKQLADNGAVIYTIGAGTTAGGPIPEEGTNEFKKDNEGRTIISKLNETILQDIANTANGKYYLLTNANNIASDIMQRISNMEKKSTNEGGIKTYASLYYVMGFLALFILIIEYFITERKTKKLLW